MFQQAHPAEHGPIPREHQIRNPHLARLKHLRPNHLVVGSAFGIWARKSNQSANNHQQTKERKNNMKSKIINYIRAGYPGLYLVSHEEQRVALEMTRIAQELKYNLVFWSVVDGLVDTQKGTNNSANDPLEALIAIRDLKEKTLILLRDFHLFLQDPNPILIRQLKDVLQMAKTKSKTLIILGCRMVLPPELEREITVIEFALPGKEELGAVLGGIMESANIKTMEAETREKVIDAASGLTTIEAENAFALSVVQSKAIDPVIVAKEKAQAVKKNGLLELIQTKETLDSIGGLDVLKEWLLKRRHAFSQRAIEYGLPTPKGLLILGIAGTGKSLTAKATAKVFGVPLLKLDAGRIFAGLVGQSESNLRAVIQTAEAIAPCCLWIDEVEKGFSGTKSSNATDGGTSSRVFGSFISWMQEKSAPVFVVATANDVSQLPAEMLRKGRFDELFFVDLPNQAEREAIWEIQIGKHGRIPSDFDIVQLAKATEGLTGSEIENVFIEALYLAFDLGREPTDLDIARVLTEFVPLSRLMTEQIGGLRNWAKGRARLATSLVSERGLRKIL
jgi:ATP-dependent 26S proteasome regulatory subunit